jgi:hypothetical protein
MFWASFLDVTVRILTGQSSLHSLVKAVHCIVEWQIEVSEVVIVLATCWKCL